MVKAKKLRPPEQPLRDPVADPASATDAVTFVKSLLRYSEEWTTHIVAIGVLCLVLLLVLLVRRKRRAAAPEESMKDIAMLLKASVDDILREKGGKSLPLRRIEAAADFLSYEFRQRIQNSPDVIRKIVNDDGATVPPRRTVQDLEDFMDFADIAYEPIAEQRSRLAAKGYTLLLHNPRTPNGAESHYIAFSPKNRLAVLGVRGEERIKDAIEDIGIAPVPFMLNDAGSFTRKKLAQAAQQLVTELLDIFTELFAPQGYSIVAVGHSLGGGIATLFTILMREECGMSKIRACCFGPPPVVDRSSALGCKSYVTSVVNHTDFIPRSSERGIKVAAGLLEGVAQSLQSGGQHRARAQILDILHKAQSMSTKTDKGKELYVAGTVIYIYTHSTGAYSAAQLDGTLSSLRHIEMVSSMITNHKKTAYREALQRLAARLPPDDPTWTWCSASPHRGSSTSPVRT